MNKETFNDLLHNQEVLKLTSSADLFDIVKEFPYCQTSRILLTMRLHQENHFKYDTELKTTALYAGDRGILKKHIDRLSYTVDEEKPPVEQAETVPEAEKSDIQLVDSVTTEENIVLAKSDKTDEETEPAIAEKVSEEIEAPLSDTALDDDIELEEQETVPPTAPEDEIIEEVAETATGSTIIEDTDTIIEAPDSEFSRVDDTEREAEPAEVIVEEEAKEEQKEAEKPKSKKKTAEEKRIAHLKSIVEARLKQIEIERQQPAPVSEPEKIEEPTETTQSEEISEDINKDESADHLIDRFIKNQPRISRRSATFFNPIDASKESIVDEESIVSETLAKIYFDQHHFEKAIKIYRKLSLIYPEKSTYFAAQIEKAVEELKK